MTNYQKISSSASATILLPTFNRRDTLGQALASALHQEHSNLQVIVINDGGQDVSDIVKSFNDERVLFIDRKENRGKAYSLNEALQYATGQYIAYLDDDDLFYPNHISTLVNALENNREYGLAYSDLYKAKCRVKEDGSREILRKGVDISRDFNRFVMLYFNHVLHVSMMHRKELLEKTGLYNEDIEVLIDWDMTRRMCFFTDFYHVTEITGEFYSPIGECDRISIQQRKNHSKYFKNMLSIRNHRPPKPWPKVGDLSIIFAPEVFGSEAGAIIGGVWKHTFYPYELYLALPESDMKRLDSSMPNLIKVAVSESSTISDRINAAIECCQGEYVVILQNGFPVTNMWVERSFYALMNNPDKNTAYELENSTDQNKAIVVRKDVLKNARAVCGNVSVLESLKAIGVRIKRVDEEELPCKFDNFLQIAGQYEEDEIWEKAAKTYQYMEQNFNNNLWMKSKAANAYYKAGQYSKAYSICEQVNQVRPTVDTLLLQARIIRKNLNYNAAIDLLKDAEDILEGKQLQWT